MLFSLRDMDGDGTIFGDEEVSGYDTQARSWGGGFTRRFKGLGV